MRKIYPFLLLSSCLFLTKHTLAQNSALNLTGSNYVTAGEDVINPNGDFTMELWANIPQAMNDGNTHQLVSEGSFGTAFYIGYGADGTIQVGDFWGPTGIPMPFGQWAHIALTYTYATSLTTLYINGKQVASSTSFAFTDDQPFRIGVQTDLSQPLTGRIDEVKAWSTPRTPSQVKADMFGVPAFNDNALVAYYKMDDGGGTLATNSAGTTGNSQDGAITGDAGGNNSWVASPIQYGNNGLVFDGVDDQVNIPAATGNAYDLAGGGTVEFWVNPTTLTSSWSTIFGNRGAGGVRYSFHLSSTQIGLDNGTTINTLDYAVPAGTTNWTHLAFVMDGVNTTTVYVNGILQGTITGTMGSSTGQPVTLGIAKNTSGADDRPFTGGIDEVRIWNTQRTGSEILANRDNTLNGTESGLIGQFSFDQGISNGNDQGLTTAIDNTTLANNGTLANFALTGTTSNFTLHNLVAVPLPLTLTAFTANRSGNETVLQWQTATEENTRDFIIERSSDGKTYTDIGATAAAGNSSSPRDYAWTDPAPGGDNNFYRLKQVDLDGNFAYSPVRVVSFPSAGKLIWYLTGRSSAGILLQQGTNENWSLFDAGGRLLRTGQLSNGRTQLSQLPPGIYFVRVATNTISIALP